MFLKANTFGIYPLAREPPAGGIFKGGTAGEGVECGEYGARGHQCAPLMRNQKHAPPVCNLQRGPLVSDQQRAPPAEVRGGAPWTRSTCAACARLEARASCTIPAERAARMQPAARAARRGERGGVLDRVDRPSRSVTSSARLLHANIRAL